MRLAILVLALSFAACQKADTEEAPRTAPAPTELVAAASAAPVDEMSCGGEAGSTCGGTCGGSCTPSTETVAPAAAIPTDAVWTSLDVRGMHCAGCARRIQRALAGVDGLYGCEVDLGGAKVKVASAPGHDGRAIASPLIAALGYQVAD